METTKQKKSIGKILGWGLFGLLVILFWGAIIYAVANYEDSESDSLYHSSGDSTCEIARVPLHNPISPYAFFDNDETIDYIGSDDVVAALYEANADEDIVAIVLDIDSTGGSTVAGEEIADALRAIEKPTIAFVRDAALSASYYAATGADKIYASQHSVIGSIGVTMSYVDHVQQNEELGLSYNQISVGKFKDAGDPNKALTEEEKKMFLDNGEKIYQNFVAAVLRNRNLGVESIPQIADAQIFVAVDALQNGLIDAIGNMFAVQNYVAELTETENPTWCWYADDSYGEESLYY